jgi:DNA polymerase-3 subunit epsilon
MKKQEKPFTKNYEMKIEKPIVFFDIETTGLSQTSDRIVEIYMRKQNVDGTEDEFYSKFNPNPVEVSAEAEKVHGMSSNDLLGEPLFSEKVNEIISFIENCDLGGYNIASFDIPMLFEEIARTGKLYDFRKHRIIDTYLIWSAFEPRTLTGACKRFLGEDHEHAHQAKADVIATKRIFENQLIVYQSQYDNISDIIDRTVSNKGKLDISGKFMQSEDGKVILTFGKHKNKTVQQIYSEDPEYFKWMFEKAEMPTDTRMIARKIYSTFQSQTMA